MKGLRVDFCPLPELYEDLEPAEAPGAHMSLAEFWWVWEILGLGSPIISWWS